MKKEFIQSIKIIILGVILSLGVGYLFAWVKSPTAIPPGGNIAAPINARSVSQTIGGGSPSGELLFVNGAISTNTLLVTTGAVVRGSVKVSGLAGSGGLCINLSSKIFENCSTAPSFPLIVTVNTPGTVTSSPSGINCGSGGGACSANMSETVALSVTPDDGHSFGGWSGACSGNGACSVTMNASKSVTATFIDSSNPSLTTNNISDITATGATSGGNISSNGGSPVTDRGVAYVASPNPPNPPPSISGLHTSNGTGSGSFTSVISGLSANTKYYVRAYATSSAGTGYANNMLDFTTSPSSPTINTNEITGVTYNSAVSGGNTILDNGATITAKGVVWNTSPDPTITLTTKTNEGTGTGNFTSNINNLLTVTTYYVRAYATNSKGTSYGPEKQFTTLDVSCGTDGHPLYGYCWYKHPQRGNGKNCNTFCANHGSCINATFTYNQEVNICYEIQPSIQIGSNDSTTKVPRIDGNGSYCFVKGVLGEQGPYTATTCSESNQNHYNICACSQ